MRVGHDRYRWEFRMRDGETAADLEIRWPSGPMEQAPGIACDQLVTIREGEGIVRSERFRRA